MCGRFVRKSTITIIEDEFDIYEVQWAFEPSYNIAPSQDIACVVGNGGNRLVKFRWGLVPFWADDPSIGYKMINARAETVSQKKSFARAFKKHRCLVVADGFYEWRKLADGKRKIPMYVHLRKERPFGFAGLYENWKSKDGKILQTCTIITTRANDLMAPIHNRMPVIIAPHDRKLWLDTSVQESDVLLPLLEPYSSAEMEAYSVSKKVNSPSYNEPDCIEPVHDEQQEDPGFKAKN
ncbi:MAG: SOS response-associated peptidase [candidate division WOR-3 bacterium]|nr:MAG: SOS response-associated peptidase [candidate division WOR-3 bacterium]